MDAWREMLVAVAGLTPQVITETLYYLTEKRNPPVAIADTISWEKSLSFLHEVGVVDAG